MAGMNGYNHSCMCKKIDIGQYLKSINESGFSAKELALIWDFYVTKSPCGESSQSISLEKYGWRSTTSKIDGYAALETALNNSISSFKLCIIRSHTIHDTLSNMDLLNDKICIEHPRAVLQQKFTITVDENEILSFDNNKEAKIVSLFRHIRNSFAHGGTYFFDNDNMLLEDKDGKTKTARILIPKKALLNWIEIIDKNGISH